MQGHINESSECGPHWDKEVPARSGVVLQMIKFAHVISLEMLTCYLVVRGGRTGSILPYFGLSLQETSNMRPAISGIFVLYKVFFFKFKFCIESVNMLNFGFSRKHYQKKLNCSFLAKQKQTNKKAIKIDQFTEFKQIVWGEKERRITKNNKSVLRGQS